MAIPDIEPSEVGDTGLLWLFLSYGYVLYFASNLISEGSDLLLLVPSMAGLVGGVVLPLLGAVPDGAIMLFSGLGDISEAQETLSVGVGALAGSTIMLLTVPWGLSIWNGRVDLGPGGAADYKQSPKLSEKTSLWHDISTTGVGLTEAVAQGAVIMMITTIPYFLIQVPALFLHGPTEQVAKGEKNWALVGFIVCLSGFVAYMRLQLQISQQGMDRGKRIAVVKKILSKGSVSLTGALSATVKEVELQHQEGGGVEASYGAITSADSGIDPEVQAYLKEILREAFIRYDTNGNNNLDKRELNRFFRDFHEEIAEQEMTELFTKFDKDNSGVISFEEFVGAVYIFLTTHTDHSHDVKVARKAPRKSTRNMATEKAQAEIAENLLENGDDDEEEAEEIPEDFTDLTPEQQQAAIKRRAFLMLAIGTGLVVMFSDPMVDVMQEIAVRMGLSPFYVSFILAPLASNASEVLASQYYAAKKTRKTITVSLTALEGAASMNNTFCLSIFMGLIYWRGLAWQYTAETLAIVAVQFIVGALSLQGRTMTTKTALMILSIFPLSILFVAGLEALGFD